MAAPGPAMAISSPACFVAGNLQMLVCAPMLVANCGTQVQQAFLPLAVPGLAHPAAGSAPAVGGNVWALSQEQEGCRQVQQALQDAATEGERSALVLELRGHVWEMMQHRFGNHVLQTCITTARPQAVQFVVDEILGRCPAGVRKAARHQYGCRVLQRLLEHCRAAQVEPLVEELIADAPVLVGHIYGNYVVQSLLEHSTPDQLRRLCRVVAQHAAAAGHDSRACAVLIRALTCAAAEEREALVGAVLAADGVLAAMAGARHGQSAAKLVLELAGEAALQEAALQLTEAAAELGRTRLGRSVLALLHRRLPQQGVLQSSI